MAKSSLSRNVCFDLPDGGIFEITEHDDGALDVRHDDPLGRTLNTDHIEASGLFDWLHERMNLL